MLNNADQIKLKNLMEQDDDFRQLVQKINDDYDFRISKMAHEIRNPLTLITSSLQIIETQHPEVKEFHFWEQTMNDVNYLRLLLDELSTYNNSEKLNLQNIQIQELLNPLIAIYLPLAKKSNISIDVSYERELPPINADPIKLREVFINLIKNALDAIGKNGILSIDVSRTKDLLIIKISDTGCGIPSDLLDTIFTPFTSYKQKGTGLGLAITKRIIDTHTGTLDVTSKINEGTTFRIGLSI
jgi:two-component system sensor histidine kinase HydH